MQIAVVSAQRSVAHARLTVRSAAVAAPGAEVHVLDVDGSYVPVGTERVLTPADVGVWSDVLHRRAVELEPGDLARSLEPALVGVLARATEATVLVAPGLVLLDDPEAALAWPDDAVVLVSRTAGPVPDDGRHPDADDLARTGAYAPVLALRAPPAGLLDLWAGLTADPSGPGARWADVAAAAVPTVVLRDPGLVVSAGSLRRHHRLSGEATPASPLLLDGRPVVALDLSALDPAAPWLLDAAGRDPRARLSDHPALAAVVARLAADLRADEPLAPGPGRLTTTGPGFAVDATLRALYRLPGSVPDDAPDPFDPRDAAAFLDLLTAPSPAGGPGRYLQALRASRPDLRDAFAHVPGRDEAGFLAWVDAHAVGEGYPAVVVEEAVRRVRAVPRPVGRPAPGVNVVGFLTGVLGIGESARLLVSALDAAGVAHRAVAVEQNLASRRRAPAPDEGAADVPVVYDTSVLCVNSDLAPTVAASVPDVVDRSYRVGMWYWEVEDFPAEQHGGFDVVDEVWVATDFVRRAVEPHSRVPVRVLTPPLPQRGAEPTLTRADLGLPDAPLFLFAFDYLSTAERKNPLGLLAAFRRAFAPGEGPVLVLKSINADQRPAEAERVRLAARAAAGEAGDVVLLEDYLDAAERDALVALSDCYVSLHRSEGLGLTMAEAMAWGKPVIATGYSGNLEFMTPENSFLVPWQPAEIPADAAPYPAGGTWAEPDLDAAAAAMRTVVDEPEVAAARGARAARDIATLHSPGAAGRRIAERLDEIADRRRARSRTTVLTRLRSTARQVRGPRA